MVQCIADESIWIPRLRPASSAGSISRWWLKSRLDGHLVSNCSRVPTLLERHGAFRDVRVWGLATDDPSGTVWLHTGFGPLARRRSSHPPDELCDSGRRRLILVIGDYMAAAWYDEKISRLLTNWARRNPVTLVQVLPERLNTVLRGVLAQA